MRLASTLCQPSLLLKLLEFSDRLLMLHATLALSEKGLPLGLLSEKIWARERQPIKGHNHAKLCIKEKESYRWLEGLREANRFISKNTEMIMVCDREADIYEFFEEAIDLDTGLVVRLSSFFKFGLFFHYANQILIL
mgnify:CR=1 FL=1